MPKERVVYLQARALSEVFFAHVNSSVHYEITTFAISLLLLSSSGTPTFFRTLYFISRGSDGQSYGLDHWSSPPRMPPPTSRHDAALHLPLPCFEEDLELKSHLGDHVILTVVQGTVLP